MAVAVERMAVAVERIRQAWSCMRISDLAILQALTSALVRNH